MNTRLINSILMIAMLLLLASCSSSRNLAYLQANEPRKMAAMGASADLYDSRFKPKDLLIITVVTSEPTASRNYNLLVPQTADATNNSLYSTPTMQSYLVDNDGTIDFPTLGKIVVAGKTRKELENEIQEKLKSAFSKERPVVTIRITNYAVNVLGEVSRPGKYQTTNDRLTIFEGLALAGDMTIYGRRDNVKILRENADGSKFVIKVDLTDKDIINSPAYYLEQNDVVYVEPNKSRSRASGINAAETFSVSALSILLSLSSLLVNILLL
ncbi:MAG: polysaccharide biosynthesis/export family protein [Bacteroidota bacterium]|nr:polysaccharide biosynthesis/export family protein [Bacteroidota bacterium]